MILIGQIALGTFIGLAAVIWTMKLWVEHEERLDRNKPLEEDRDYDDDRRL